MSDALRDGWLIYKTGRGWYRPNAQGYTAHPNEAGRYTLQDALSYSHPNGVDGPRDGLSIKHESDLPPTHRTYTQAELDAAVRAAYEEGWYDGAKVPTSERGDQVLGWACLMDFDRSAAAIRARGE